MTKKAKYLEDKLNICKIIPDDYYKKLKEMKFYINQEKKDTQRAIFESEAKKIKV